MCVLYYYGRVEPEFYVPLFYVILVFYMALSRTKWTFSRISELYYGKLLFSMRKNLVLWGHVKYRFHCILNYPGMNMAPKNQEEERRRKKRRGDRQKRRRGDGREEERERGQRRRGEETGGVGERWAEEEEEVVRSIFDYSLSSGGRLFTPSKEEGGQSEEYCP